MSQSTTLDNNSFPSVEDAQIELFFNPTAEGYTRLGFAYQNHDLKMHQAGKFQVLALDSYCRAMTLNPDPNLKVLLYHNLGILHYMMGNMNTALLAQEKAERLSVHNLQKVRGSILYEKGMALKALSRFDEGLDAFRHSIAFDNLFGHSYLGAVNCLLSMSAQNSLLEQLYRDMRRVEKKIDVASRRAALLQGMFEILHRLGRESEAYESLMKSRDILKLASGGAVTTGEQQSQSAREAIARATSIMTIFQPGFWPRSVGHPSRFPIFIVGMMRSGSTLLEQMLHMHSRILGQGEDSVFNANLRSAKDQIVQLSMQDSTNAKGMADLVNFHADYMIGLMKEKLPAKYTSSSSSVSRSNPGDETDEDDRVYDCKFADADDEEMCSRYETRRRTTSSPNSKDDNNDGHTPPILHVVDKMLFNYRNIGLIRLIFPNALVINMVRDPMDTLWSCLRHKFDDNGLEFTYDIKDLVTEFVTYLEIMAHWRHVLPGFVIDVRYEALVDNPRSIIEPILTSKLELAWEEGMNRFYESDRSVITHSVNQVRRPLYKTSIGAWRTYRQQLQPLMDVLTPFIRQIKGRGGLPFVDDLNWDLNPEHLYPTESSGSNNSVSGMASSTSAASVASASASSQSSLAASREKKKKKV